MFNLLLLPAGKGRPAVVEELEAVVFLGVVGSGHHAA
jgi:hypothetical protein